MSYDILCVGMALVDSIIRGFDPEPVSASGYRAESCALNVGGEAVNESMAAAKLGLHTGILCSLGEDDAGALIESALRRCGVDTGPAVRTREHPTPITTMFVNGELASPNSGAAPKYTLTGEFTPGVVSMAATNNVTFGLLGSDRRYTMFSGGIRICEIVVFNTMGQQVFLQSQAKGLTTLNLEGLDSGMYFVTVKSANTVSTLKFVKE